MKKLTTFLCLVLPATMFACAVCGGSASNQSLGIQPQFYRHFVGLQYQYRTFHSTHAAHGPETAGSSDETYNTYQLWGRYNAGQRLRLFGFLPYISNVQKINGSKTVYSGIGDMTVLANVRVLNTVQTDKEWLHDLQLGGGVKLPTGSYSRKSIAEGEGLPNMQPGTRSWDAVANINYTIRRASAGLNVDASYTIVTPNADDYKFGNRLSTGLTAFYWWQAKAYSILPQAGLKLDASACDYEYYSWNIKNDMTGGQLLYLSAGVQAFYRSSGIQFTYYLPVYQHYADGMVKSRFRTEAGIYFLF